MTTTLTWDGLSYRTNRWRHNRRLVKAERKSTAVLARARQVRLELATFDSRLQVVASSINQMREQQLAPPPAGLAALLLTDIL